MILQKKILWLNQLCRSVQTMLTDCLIGEYAWYRLICLSGSFKFKILLVIYRFQETCTLTNRLFIVGPVIVKGIQWRQNHQQSASTSLYHSNLKGSWTAWCHIPVMRATRPCPGLSSETGTRGAVGVELWQQAREFNEVVALSGPHPAITGPDFGEPGHSVSLTQSRR